MQTFSARGLLGDRRLAYVDADAPGELRQSATLFWEEPPAEATAIVTASVLRAAGAAPVVTNDARGLADYWLSGRLDRFEYVRARNGGAAVVAVEFTLTRARDHRVLLVMSSCAAVPEARDDAPHLAAAFDDAMGRVLADLVPDLTRRTAGARGVPDAGRRAPGC